MSSSLCRFSPLSYIIPIRKRRYHYPLIARVSSSQRSISPSLDLPVARQHRQPDRVVAVALAAALDLRRAPPPPARRAGPLTARGVVRTLVRFQNLFPARREFGVGLGWDHPIPRLAPGKAVCFSVRFTVSWLIDATIPRSTTPRSTARGARRSPAPPARHRAASAPAATRAASRPAPGRNPPARTSGHVLNGLRPTRECIRNPLVGPTRPVRIDFEQDAGATRLLAASPSACRSSRRRSCAPLR